MAGSFRRLSIPVSRKLYNRQQNLIPWGQRALAFRLLITQLLDMVEEHGVKVLIDLHVGRVKLQEDPNVTISPEVAERALSDYINSAQSPEDDED